MIIYNLFPLLAGHMGEWKSHIDRAADMGFDWIFVNPIQKPGMSGSLYSIADYFQINPLFIDPDNKLSAEEQMREVTKAAEQRGMGMMVDLVINHCAIDSELTKQHDNWFMHEGNGSIAHPFCIDGGEKVVWGDLARFDHQHTADPEGLYQFFREIVEYLIKLGFKGFRCDAAYQLPRQLWERLINDVRAKYPDAVFTAETLGCSTEETKETAQAGFDYVFNSSKWWDFHGPWLMAQYQLVREIAPSISFPESHDTDRLFEEVQGNVNAVKQRFLFSSLYSAGSMITMGFEFGFRKRMHVVETRPSDWEESEIDLRNFITKVNAVKQRYGIFQEDCPTSILPYHNSNILLLWKASNKSPEEALLILNKDPWNHQSFQVDNLSDLVQAGAPLRDVSPEYSLDYIPTQPFSYDLRPGQGLVLVTDRNELTNQA